MRTCLHFARGKVDFTFLTKWFTIALATAYQLQTVYVTTENISIWELADYGTLRQLPICILGRFLVTKQLSNSNNKAKIFAK